MIKACKDIYTYREMLFNLVRKDLRTRYKGSILGFFWTFLNPLLQLVVYTIVFSTVMRVNIDKFYMFLFVGLVPWTFFSTSILSGSASIIGSKDLIKKIYFPKEVIPLATVTSNFMNMLFTMLIVFAALFISGIGVSSNSAFLPLVFIVEYLLVLGITFLVAALNVYFRDLEHILGIVMMAWFYLTPIVYPMSMIPTQFRQYFSLNPMLYIINAYRDILFYKKAPDAMTMLSMAGFSLVLIVFGHFVFKLLEKGFAEEI